MTKLEEKTFFLDLKLKVDCDVIFFSDLFHKVWKWRRKFNVFENYFSESLKKFLFGFFLDSSFFSVYQRNKIYFRFKKIYFFWKWKLFCFLNVLSREKKKNSFENFIWIFGYGENFFFLWWIKFFSEKFFPSLKKNFFFTTWLILPVTYACLKD